MNFSLGRSRKGKMGVLLTASRRIALWKLSVKDGQTNTRLAANLERQHPRLDECCFRASLLPHLSMFVSLIPLVCLRCMNSVKLRLSSPGEALHKLGLPRSLKNQKTFACKEFSTHSVLLHLLFLPLLDVNWTGPVSGGHTLKTVSSVISNQVNPQWTHDNIEVIHGDLSGLYIFSNEFNSRESWWERVYT